MTKHFRTRAMTPEDALALMTVPVLEIVPVSDGFALSVDVVDDDDAKDVERRYFAFDDYHSPQPDLTTQTRDYAAIGSGKPNDRLFN